MAIFDVSNGTVIDEERRGWSLSCPHCGDTVRYTILNVPGEPFLYCDKTSDFVLRDEDAQAIASFPADEGREPLFNLRRFYEALERELAPCPNGGRFTIWANVRCPYCAYEFPYNDGNKSEAVRYFEPKIIWIEGATAFRGANMASNRLLRVRT